MYNRYKVIKLLKLTIYPTVESHWVMMCKYLLLTMNSLEYGKLWDICVSGSTCVVLCVALVSMQIVLSTK